MVEYTSVPAPSVLDVPEVDEPLRGPPMPPEPLDPGTSVVPEPEEERE